MQTTTPVWVPILVAAVAAAASLLVALLTGYEQRRKLSAELDLQRRKFEQELAAQRTELSFQQQKFEQELATQHAALEFQREKFEQELEAQRAKLQTEHATELSVEKALQQMLSIYELSYRSFQMIRHHIGGFEANELRKLLVRAGAVRFMAADGAEIWALISQVESDFKYGRWKHAESPRNRVSATELFPGAFNESTHF